VKSNSAIRIAMLQPLLQSGALFSAARALWAALCAATLPHTPKMGLALRAAGAMGNQRGEAFGAFDAGSVDPGGLALTS
jgi:hypothetical protein